MSHDVCQGTSFQKLHDHPELITNKVAVVHVDHIVMVVIPHDHHLHTREIWLMTCDGETWLVVLYGYAHTVNIIE